MNNVFTINKVEPSILNQVNETTRKEEGRNIDNMQFISGKNIEKKEHNNIVTLSTPNEEHSLKLETLRQAIKDGMGELNKMSPAILALIVALFKAFNANNKMISKVNAALTKLNEEIVGKVAEEYKSKGYWDLGASVVNTGLSVTLGVIANRQSVKSTNLQKQAAHLEATGNNIPPKNISGAPEAVNNSPMNPVQNTAEQTGAANATGNTASTSPADPIVNNDLLSADEPSPTERSTTMNVTVDDAPGESVELLRAEASRMNTLAMLLQALINIRVLGDLVSLGGRGEEAKQVMDQNYAQVASTLYQTGTSDAENNKKYMESMFQTMLSIIDNIIQARDTAAQNC